MDPGVLNRSLIMDTTSMVIFRNFLDNVIGLWASVLAVITEVSASAKRVVHEVYLTL